MSNPQNCYRATRAPPVRWFLGGKPVACLNPASGDRGDGGRLRLTVQLRRRFNNVDTWNFRVLNMKGETVADHTASGIVIDEQGIKLMGDPAMPGGAAVVIATYSPTANIVVGGPVRFGALSDA